MRKRNVLILVIVFSFLFMIVSCGREEDKSDNTSSVSNNSDVQKITLTVPGDITWMKTDVLMDPGTRVKITASDPNLAEGDPIGRRFDPVKMFGHGGLIGKIGEEGVPFPIGKEKEVQGNSSTQGEYLYIGRNITLAMPSGFTQSVMDVYTPATDATEVESAATISEFLQPLQVTLYVSNTDAPALLAPIDDFWLKNQSPTFKWDDIDNAIQYIFEVSEFPDFRSIFLAINTINSSVNTATINNSQQLIPNPNNNRNQAVFQEGVYYWRVRAELNAGRTLAPEPKWSERSVVWKFGIEEEGAIDQPQILNPKPDEEFSEGSNVLIDFLTPQDGSGLLWRIRFYHAECGKVIDTTEISPEKVLLWRVFQTQIDSDVVNEPPKNYGYYLASSLDRGEWVFMVQLRDGADPDGERISSAKVHITVGCNR